MNSNNGKRKITNKVYRQENCHERGKRLKLNFISFLFFTFTIL